MVGGPRHSRHSHAPHCIGLLCVVQASATAIAHPRTGKPGKTITYAGVEATAVPRALRTAEIAGRLREDYRQVEQP